MIATTLRSKWRKVMLLNTPQKATSRHDATGEARPSPRGSRLSGKAVSEGLTSSPSMDSIHQREARAFIERWDKDYVDGAELLAAVRGACPKCSDQDLRAALDAVAHGPFTTASACAAAALCQMAGLGNPPDTAYKLAREGRPLTEPQWFALIAGYSYNWIINSGLTACYFHFDDPQYADRIRVYDTIGAKAAAAVLRDADQAFGEAGPPPTVAERVDAGSDELLRRFDEELYPRFKACGKEIFTCIFLYALDHPGDFKGMAGQ